MPLRAILILWLAFPVALAAQSQPSSASIVRLAPSAFPSLPNDLVRALDSRHCRIPQTSDATTPENVIGGAFTAAHVTEWAARCSIADTGRVLVFQRRAPGDVRVVDSLDRGPDIGCMQGIGNDRWGYSCRLQLRQQRTILSWSGSVHSRIDHDAIESVFVGKSAVAYYFSNGRWHQFVTAD